MSKTLEKAKHLKFLKKGSFLLKKLCASFQLGWCPHLSAEPVCFEMSPLVDPALCPLQMSLVNRLFPHTLLCCVNAQFPHSSDVGPSLIAHSSRMCWKLETISPSVLTPHHQQCNGTTYPPCLTLDFARPTPTSSQQAEESRKCSVLVSRAGRRLLYQQWKTDEISFGAGQAPCYMFELKPLPQASSSLYIHFMSVLNLCSPHSQKEQKKKLGVVLSSGCQQITFVQS